MLRVAGIPFEIGPESSLSPSERQALSGFERQEDGAPFRIDIVRDAMWNPPRDQQLPSGRLAFIESDGASIRLANTQLRAVLDPMAGVGSLYRQATDEIPLVLTLVAAMCSRIPLTGGLALHAAAVVRRGESILFFGPSGAGKSTLSERSPFPVISDELVVVRASGTGFEVSAAGLFGAYDRPEAPRGAYPVRALVELHQGGSFRLEKTPRPAILPKMIAMSRVPPARSLWEHALRVVTSLGRTVPVYDMTWSLDDDPWPALEPLWASAR